MVSRISQTAVGRIAQFTVTINSNVCPHIWVLHTLMRESYADVIGIFNSKERY